MATLLIKHPDGSESEQELLGELTLGRAEGNDVILAEGGVSRRHARIYTSAGQIYVEDSGSANGTFVDSQRIEAPTELSARSQLVIGDYEISLRAPKGRPVNSSSHGSALPRGSGRVAARPALSTKSLPGIRERALARAPGVGGREGGVRGRALARSSVGSKASGPGLRGLSGPWASKLFPVRGKVTVGRLQGLQIQIEDDSVSRRHAELEPTAEGLVMRDLGSANGTLVNGEPALGEVLLAPGDVIQFGVVEMVVEGPDRGSGVVRRRGGSRRGFFLFLGAAVAVSALIAVIKLATTRPPGDGVGTPARTAEPGDIQEYLSQCRSYASPETSEPDWKRAEAACKRALDLDPINQEAAELLKKINRESAAFDHYEKGQRALQRLHEDDAIRDEFSKIPKDSFYYAKVKMEIQPVVEASMKRAADECKKYFSNGFWTDAARSCERYMTFACQSMPLAEVKAPLGYVVKAPNNPKKKQWWPRDPMYQKLLLAQEQERTSKPFNCEYVAILRKDTGPPPAEEEVRRSIEQRFPDRAIAAALMNYWYGKTTEAVVSLQKILDDSDKTPLHAQARQLKKAIFEAAGELTNGQTALQKDDLESAAKSFDDVLQIDKELMKDEAERKPSFFRHNIQTDIAQKAYERGRFFADREDYRKGCKMWKIGFRFFKGNTELLKATTFCSAQAQKQYDAAQTCLDLDKVLDYAVEGDSFKEKVAERRSQMQCP